MHLSGAAFWRLPSWWHQRAEKQWYPTGCSKEPEQVDLSLPNEAQGLLMRTTAARRWIQEMQGIIAW